jgi:hypothetical protein
MVRRLAIVLFALAAASCGSSASGSGETREPAAAPVAAADPAAERQAGAEQKLRAAQESAVGAMCERLVDCSVADARASMSKEEVDKLDLATTVPKARAQCESEASKSALSPRQVKVIQHCVSEPSDCQVLATCLDEASKK